MRFPILCWLLLVISIHYGHCCEPAVLDQKYTMTSTANVPSGARVVWELGDTAVVLYDSSQPSPNLYPNLCLGSTTQLTLLEVHSNFASKTFHHIVNGNIVYSCTLKIGAAANVQ